MTYSYEEEAIINGMAAIRKAHNDIDDKLDALEKYAEQQLAGWDGDAKQMYWQCKREWDASVDQMKEVMISKAVPALDTILTNYDLTEKMNAKTWQQG